MLKNVVFDFGQVLVRFEPSYMVGRYVTDPKDAALLEDVIFDRLYWDPLDAGTISDAAVVEACKARLPERLWDVTEKIYYNWIYNLPEIDGMDALLAIVQMPPGIPVATVGVNASLNAAILAVEMLSLADDNLAGRLAAYKENLKKKIEKANEELKELEYEYKTN